MKLRNKKTGEIADLAHRGLLRSNNDGNIIAYPEGTLKYYTYGSLAELNDDWEDYTPTEPLIKDEKARKAVRAWAEAVGGSPVCFYGDTDYEGVGRLKIYREGYPAVFDLGHQFYDLELDNQYTIAELCGEEEE